MNTHALLCAITTVGGKDSGFARYSPRPSRPGKPEYLGFFSGGGGGGGRFIKAVTFFSALLASSGVTLYPQGAGRTCAFGVRSGGGGLGAVDFIAGCFALFAWLGGH